MERHYQYAVQMDASPPPQRTRSSPQFSCCDVLQNWGVIALCPCLPAAQVASSLGNSYGVTLASSLIFFVGGIVCYGVGMTMHEPVVKWEYDWLPFLVAWLLYALGLWATIVFNGVVVFFVFVSTVTDETGDTDVNISNTAVAFVCIHAAAQILQAYDVLRLHLKLRRRADVRSLRFESVCCPACSLAHAAASVKSISGASVCNMAPLDELPAYRD